MAPKNKGVNTKVAAANAKKAVVQSAKNAKKAVAEESATASDWAQGSDARQSNKRADEERKRIVMDEKNSEIKRLEALDEERVSGVKVVKRSKGKAKKIDKPWELAVAVPVQKGGKSRKQMEKNTVQVKKNKNIVVEDEDGYEQDAVFEGLAPAIRLGSQNRNRDLTMEGGEIETK